jgi:undecaprenyl diphosphate synthase
VVKYPKIKNMVSHLALIPDGNRRWAKKRGLPPWRGHLAGAKNFERILKKVLEMKIPYFTFWGMSADNVLKRPKEEVKRLFSIFRIYFDKILKAKAKEKVKVNVFGRWEEILPSDLRAKIEEIVEKTKKNEGPVFTLLLAYNGTDEMLAAIKKITQLVNKKNVPVDEKLLLKSLWTGSLPPVDLVIRTGCQGDPHNSAGFMMWQTAYSQFYFTKTLFPDFSPQELEGAIEDYLKREKKFGR